jgi:hypothetical protein
LILNSGSEKQHPEGKLDRQTCAKAKMALAMPEQLRLAKSLLPMPLHTLPATLQTIQRTR